MYFQHQSPSNIVMKKQIMLHCRSVLSILVIAVLLASCDSQEISVEPESTNQAAYFQSILDKAEGIRIEDGAEIPDPRIQFVNEKPEMYKFDDIQSITLIAEALDKIARFGDEPLQIHAGLQAYVEQPAYEDEYLLSELALADANGQIMVGDSIYQFAGDHALISDADGNADRVFMFRDQRVYSLDQLPSGVDIKSLSQTGPGETTIMSSDPCAGQGLDRCHLSYSRPTGYDAFGSYVEVAAQSYHDAYKTWLGARRAKARTRLMVRGSGSSTWNEIVGKRLPNSWVKVTLFNRDSKRCEIHNQKLKATAYQNGTISVRASNGRDGGYGVAYSQHTAYVVFPDGYSTYIERNFLLDGEDSKCDAVPWGDHVPY